MEIKPIIGCDKISEVYFLSYAALCPIMLNDNETVSIGNMVYDLSEIDMSALGVYIGKFVEQEINCSIVQLMRQYCGIDMPDYYCRYCDDWSVDADVKTSERNIVRLNASDGPRNNRKLRTLAMGDAFHAFQVLCKECPEMVEEYAWLTRSEFQEAWRNLFRLRNESAHTGVLLDKKQMKEMLMYFNKFLKYMPQILDLKRELAPDGMYDDVEPVVPPCVTIPIDDARKAKREVDMIPPPSVAVTPPSAPPMKVVLPPPPIEVAQRYADLIAEWRKQGEMTDSVMEGLNSISVKYCLFTVIFEENGKKGMKDILGNVIVPALYDELGFVWDSILNPRTSITAMKDKKFGLVAVDGSGTELTEFKYDLVDTMAGPWLAPGYVFKDEGCEGIGIMDVEGREIIPCIIDKYYEPCQFVYFKSGDKWGLWDYSDRYLEPLFDNIEVLDVDVPILFTKEGVVGYVNYDFEFVPKSQVDAIEDENERYDAMLEFLMETSGPD